MTEFTKRVAATSDNVYCTSSGATFTAGDENVYFGDISNVEYYSGLRFTNITIPQGATIESAILTLRSFGNFSTNTITCSIYCVDEDNHNGFSNTAGDRPNDTTKTTAYASWTPTAWTTDTSYNTADFTDAVQEVVDRVGWSSGNALSVIFTTVSTTNAHRAFDSYGLGEGTAALLTINYTSAAGPANLKTYNTNATANIKTINTNAIANIKSLNTNT